MERGTVRGVDRPLIAPLLHEGEERFDHGRAVEHGAVLRAEVLQPETMADDLQGGMAARDFTVGYAQVAYRAMAQKHAGSLGPVQSQRESATGGQAA